MTEKRPEELTFEELTAHLPGPQPGTMKCRGHACAFAQPNTEPSDYDPEDAEEGEEPPALGTCTSEAVAAMDPNSLPGGTWCPHFKPVDPEVYRQRMAAIDSACED